MGQVLTIAGRDFRSYFASVKGPALLFFFLLITGLFFRDFVARFAQMQQQGPMMGGQSPTLEQLLGALFYNMHFVLLFIIPIVTMSTFAEGRVTHTLRLLQTAPISPIQIVLGKFLAAVFFMAVMLAAGSVYPLFTVQFGNPDIAVIGVSYLGLFLLVCAQLSLGIWISSMAGTPLMAFLFTTFALFFLLILNFIAPNLSGGSAAEGIVKHLATTDHLDTFLKGMLTVSDTAYFLCFAGLFLFFTNVILDSQRWR